MSFRALHHCVSVFGKDKLCKDLPWLSSAEAGGNQSNVLIGCLGCQIFTRIGPISNDGCHVIRCFGFSDALLKKVNITAGIAIVLVISDHRTVHINGFRDIRRIAPMFFPGFLPICGIRV